MKGDSARVYNILPGQTVQVVSFFIGKVIIPHLVVLSTTQTLDSILLDCPFLAELRNYGEG